MGNKTQRTHSFALVCRGALCATLLLGAATMARAKQDSPLGVNFWFFNDWQTVWPFVDFFKTSRTFWAQPVSSTSPWSVDTVLQLDTNGYPTRLPTGIGAVTLMFWGDGGHHPVGDYVCLWDGDGAISFAYNASVQSTATNRMVVRVSGNNQGTLLKITRTNPANPVRNIRFIAPGFESTYQTQRFHPLFLQRLENFKVVRFMDWMGTNEAAVENWADRPKVTWQTQVDGERGGLAIEHLIALANATGCEPWFCMPCGATDDYMRQFARLVRDSLRPDLRVYLEYANEVWNGMFRARSYCSRMGSRLGWNTTSDTLWDWSACTRYWGYRMVGMFQIWRQEIPGDRVVRVFGTQFGNRGVMDGVLGQNDGWANTDAVGVAPYFGGSGSTVTDIINSCNTNIAGYQDDFEWFQAQVQPRGIKLICYEAGLDLYGNSNLLAVRRDSRLKQTYLNYFSLWKQCGGCLMVHYTFCDNTWGLFEYMDQDTNLAPSWLAAQEFIANNPLWCAETPLAAAPAPAAGLVRGGSNHIAVVRLGDAGMAVRVTLGSGQRAPDLAVFTLSGERVAKLAGAAARVDRGPGMHMAEWTLAALAPGRYLVQSAIAGRPLGESVLVVK